MGEHIRVNMSGEEFIAWKTKKNVLSPKTKKALPYFIIAILILIGGSVIYDILFYTPSSIFSSWYTALPSILQLDFINVLKFGVAYTFPWIVACIGISWIIHGVGFKIIER